MYSAILRNKCANVTLLASLSLQGMDEAFILDNLNARAGAKVRRTIEAQGCRLLLVEKVKEDTVSICTIVAML